MEPQAIGVVAIAMLVVAIVLIVAGDSRFGRAVGPTFTLLVIAIMAILSSGGGE